MNKPKNPVSPIDRALRTRAIAEELGDHLADLDGEAVHFAVRALVGGLLDRTGVVEVVRDEDGHRVWHFDDGGTIEEVTALVAEPVVAVEAHARGFAASVATVDPSDAAEVAATRAALRHVLQAARAAMGPRWQSVARVLLRDLVADGGVVSVGARYRPDDEELHVERWRDLDALERAWGNVEVEFAWPVAPGR